MQPYHMFYLKPYTSPIGPMTMCSDGEFLCGLWFDGQKYDRSISGNSPCCERNLPVFDVTTDWLNTYFDGQIPSLMPPLKILGSEFRKSVCKAMLNIPYGTTTTYGLLAKSLYRPCMYAQAIGSAVGHNPISIIIPCHRVVGSHGQLTGYAGGLDKKSFLLTLESQTIKK